MILRRPYKNFILDKFLSDVKSVSWAEVYKQRHPDEASEIFMKLLMPVVEEHAPLKKSTVRTTKAPWMDEELKSVITQRNEAKTDAVENGSTKY